MSLTKDEILGEIRRTAAENAGVPVGWRRFQQMTGIKPYDWGKYWARFSDAQGEAGFNPNNLNTAFDNAFVSDKLISLVRELQAFPTYAEMRVKRAQDPSFPHDRVFSRLGTKNALVGRVLDYCGDKPEYQDVVELCEAIYKPSTTAAPTENGQAAPAKYGFVYLAKGHPGEYKIGRTNLVDRRMSELGATAAVELQLIHEIKTDDPSGVEAYWHKRFEGKRIRGEWFQLRVDDVAAFKRWRRIT
ncbi:MAG: GIY-YIG nuclease family protein [Solirubrobacteraceae bacterium]|jgi:hypothetical protein